LTKDETIKLIGIVTMAYPNFDKFKDEKHIRSLVAFWADMFADDDSVLVALAVKKHISTSKWPPSIAEIREILVDITCPGLLQPEAAWDLVSRTLFAVGEYCHEDIRSQLPRPVYQTVESLGYSNLWKMRGKRDGLARLAFIQSYKERIERMRNDALLPASLREKMRLVRMSFDDGTRELLETMNRRYEDKREMFQSIANRDLLDIPELEDAAAPLLTSGKNDELEDTDEYED